MRSIPEELWYGNVCPSSGCREGTKEVKELMGYISDHHEALLGMLIVIEVFTEPERQ